MALSGEFYGSTNNGFIKPKITWQARQSPEENCSLVTATLTYSRTNTGYTTAGFWSGSLCIDTDTKTDSRNISISYESDTVAITHTVQVEHDAYGCAQVSISATGSIYGTTLESTTISQLITLDTIALASTIGATDAFVEAVSMVAISRKNAAYTHTVELSCNGYEGYLTENGSLTDAPEKLSATAIAFTVPESFYALLPDSPTAQVQLTCVTYNGDTQVGTPQEAAFTVTARESLCAPVLTLSAEDAEPATTALTGGKSTLVRFCSRVRCTISAQGQKGAQIVARRINGTETQLDALEFSQVESGVFTASVTDSRGYTTQQQVELPMVNYIQLTVNVSAKRMDPTSGKALLLVWGNYFNGSFGAQDNALTLTCHTGTETVQLQPVITDEGYRAEAVIEGLDYLSHHILTVTATDAIGAVSATERVKPGIPVFDWGQKDFAFHVPVTLSDGSAAVSETVLSEAVGKLPQSDHTHKAEDITSGVLPLERGGTGAATPAGALAALGIQVDTLLEGAYGLGTYSLPGSYQLYVISGRTLANNARCTMTIPAPGCDGAGYQLFADGAWVCFSLHPGEISVYSISNGGTITGVYGIHRITEE